MKETAFYAVFLEFMQVLYSAELQIVEALPSLIKRSTNSELKKELTEHLGETKEHVHRLEKVFDLLEEPPQGKTSKGMAGILEEGNAILNKEGLTPAIIDGFIIIAAQQVRHYEIASYGSAIALLEHFHTAAPEKEHLKDAIRLLNDNLKEEKMADRKLTKIAEGKMFLAGVNDEIEKEIQVKR